jgi:hypothetical protein
MSSRVAPRRSALTVPSQAHDPAHPGRRISRSLHKCSRGATKREKVQSKLRTYTGCRLSRLTASDGTPDLAIFSSSHGDDMGVCLKKRFHSYSLL